MKTQTNVQFSFSISFQRRLSSLVQIDYRNFFLIVTSERVNRIRQGVLLIRRIRAANLKQLNETKTCCQPKLWRDKNVSGRGVRDILDSSGFEVNIDEYFWPDVLDSMGNAFVSAAYAILTRKPNPIAADDIK